MKIFIGELPPPFGGVAVKDKLMFQEVYQPAGVKMLNLVECKWKPWKIPIIGVKLIWVSAVAEQVIVGVGTNWRRKILMSLRKILRGKKGLKNLHMIVMGGQIQEVTKGDKKLCSLLKDCGSVWVETNGMRKSLISQGFDNVKIFPNCRTDENSLKPTAVNGKIHYVYFSRICEEKGVDDIIEAVEHNNGTWSVDFYGEIAETYKEKFMKFLQSNPNVKYHGVFDSTNGSVYLELNKYDAMLLPSRWVGEGVPGALVEAKMAGIAAVVSDWNFNSEVVIDDVEGIVFRGNLTDTLNSCTPQRMNKYKQKSYESRMRYCVSSYKENLLFCLKGRSLE